MRVTEYTINYIPIASSIQAQRNGKDFGATTRFRCSEHEQDTVESAKADCEKRCKASYNRVARNAAKHNGVYTNSGEF